jgi:uncharacterized protein YndB with AHSA1/START domain
MPAPKPHAETDPDFVYVVYMRTTPERVWTELTNNRDERPWWGNTRHDCAFTPGAPMRFARNGGVDVEGEILEADPPHRLVYTFHVSGPGPQHDEGPTRVEYLIEADGPRTRLTVTHSNFKRDSAVRRGISKGWPSILSSLKTWIEVGPDAVESKI